MSEVVLEMRHITKRFPGVTALTDVSMQLQQGEILSLCGENGAGKSTLMKVLAGDYAHGTYEGEILVNNAPVRITHPRDAEKVGIAMIYQDIRVELDLSVAENIMLGSLPKNKLGLVDWKAARRLAKEALALMQVEIDVNLSMRQLSASMQQLVCIARALARHPKILILDEPTAALTESETETLLGILQDLRRQGISCIYISHKLKEVFEISDRIYVMRDSKHVSTYLKDEIDSERVIEDMIGRHMDAMYPSMEGRTIGEEMLRVENFRVVHPSSSAKNIIEDVSFSVRKGEVLGIAGLVGSGRSELLRAIFGALPKTRGKVYIDGQEKNIRDTQDAIQAGLGFLTEDRKRDGIVGTMNIRENMTLAILRKISNNSFISSRKEGEEVARYFDSLKIKAPSAETNIMSLSGGNQQKVVLAKSLMTEMKVLFLDEPTVGIDVGAKSEIYKIIRDLAESGLSIVMVSGEYPELLAMCDRFVVITGGEVSGELAKADANETTLIRMASSV